jgi:RNA polymerase sigma factor (sigma-70 family)
VFVVVRFVLHFARKRLKLVFLHNNHLLNRRMMNSAPGFESEIAHWDSMRKGDKASFAWIYDHYFKLLYNYGKKIGVETQPLEDAIHDLFVDLWRLRENLSPTTSVRFYLYRSLRRKVSRNAANGHYFTSLEQILESAYPGTVPSSEQQVIEDEIHHQRVYQLRKFLNNLSPRQYEALVLRFYDELSFEEIGAILNMNEQSARNLVQRGIVQLKHYARLVISFSLLLLLIY